MILVKKINKQDLIVNCELIETIEFSHDAVISLTTGEKIIVSDGPEELIRKVIEYKRAIGQKTLEIRAGNATIEAI